MRVVVAGYGSTGDTLPLIALAAGLKKAAHEVVLVTDEAAGATAGRLGLDFRELAGSARQVVAEGSHGWGEMMERGRLSPQAVLEIGRFHTREWLATISEAARGADVLVCSALGLHHAASVAQDQKLPLVAVQLQPTMPTRDYPHSLLGLTHTPRWLNRPLGTLILRAADLTFTRGINRARRELGRSPLGVVWDEVPILMAWSATLLPAASDWTHPDFTITGAWYLPTPPEWQPPVDLVEFLDAGDPPIYVGFGSMSGFGDATALRDRILEGLSGHRVLLSAGWAGLTDGALPDNVHPIGPVPHDWLFPRCSAIVHHCGAGTSHQAARSGVPSLPVPFTADQPFWAGRLRTLGIASAPLNPRKLGPDAVRTALAEAVAGSTRERALRVAERLAAEPAGVGIAINEIDRIATRTGRCRTG